MSSQVKGRAVKIRPKTKDWLKGLQEEIIGKRDSLASMSPTANSCLLEETFDFTSLDYESEGESPCEGVPGPVARWAGVLFSQPRHKSLKSPSEPRPREGYGGGLKGKLASPVKRWLVFTCKGDACDGEQDQRWLKLH